MQHEFEPAISTANILTSMIAYLYQTFHLQSIDVYGEAVRFAEFFIVVQVVIRVDVVYS